MKKSVLCIVLSLCIILTMGFSVSCNHDADATSFALGDVDKDNSVTSFDALLTLQASIHSIQLDDDVFPIADVDNNNSLNSVDSLLILQFSIKKISAFPSSDSLLEFHFIDVGQGDSIFVELPNGETMLVDAGESQYADTVTDYIKSQGHNNIDYLVATHNHSDHMGGLSGVVNSLSVENVYKTTDTATTQCYNNFISSVNKSGATVHNVTAGYMILDTDILDIMVVGPVSVPNNDPNNASIVIWVIYKNCSFLLMGDAEEKEEITLASGITANVVKIGHHGSSTSSSQRFINSVHATYGIISVGQNNKYNHPASQTLARWINAGVSLFRTDLSGTVTVSSTGYKLTVNNQVSAVTEPPSSIVAVPISPSVSSHPPVSSLPASSAAYPEPSKTYYVINKSTKKFHLPSCRYAGTISANNKLEGKFAYDELINMGYDPCKTCIE